MIVCPVCEHAQAQGAECEVCGKKFLQGAPEIPFVPPVEGLDPTRYADVDVGEATLPGLEATGHAAVDVPTGPEPDLDRGRAAPVVVAPDRLPGLERGEEGIPGDAPTAVPAIVTCRYCRTPALPGDRVCGRCGMRLPVFAREPEGDPAPPRVCSCGTVVAGALCPSCGARMT
jgi:hypothetical protein